MADLSITAASVLSADGSRVQHGVAGAAVTAGQQVYYDETTGTWKLADADGAAALRDATKMGVALNGAAANQPLTVHRKGRITIGATLTAGVAYYLSNTPGGICALADVGSGEYVVFLGLATSTTVLDYAPLASGTAN